MAAEMKLHDAVADLQLCVWRERLDDLIADRMSTPFTWGTHDCCLFAADAVMAQTDTDPASGLRGTYASARDAMELLTELGGLPAVAARAGAAIPALCAQVGDIGLVEHESRALLAVCAGPVWLVPAEQGLAALPIDAATSAWRVTKCP
jgi:hypothetical protein